jgi:hypothetical protein
MSATHRVRTRRRRVVLVASLMTLVGVVLVVAGAGHRHGLVATAQAPVGAVSAQPQLGVFNPAGATLLGAAPKGATGDPAETWAWTRLSAGIDPVVDGTALSLATGATGQLALLRSTEQGGWRVVQTPVDDAGAPSLGGTGNPEGRVTPAGGIALVVDDRAAAAGATPALLTEDPGGALRTAPAPDTTIVLPASGSLGAERLSSTVIAAADGGGHTVAYVSVEGRDPQTAIARYDGDAWTREPVCVDDGNGGPDAACQAGETLQDSTGGLRIVALATAGDQAWMLAAPSAASGLGPQLFRRVGQGSIVRWALADLRSSLLAHADLPASGVTGLVPLPSSWALTATTDGVWLDARFALRGTPTDLTAFVGATQTTTWCAEICDRPLGLRFARNARSFAWPGTGVGTRVIADVALAGENLTTTDAEHYATLDGDAFTIGESYNPRPAQGRSAFAAPDEGWIGASHLTRAGAPATEAQWPIPVRRPLTALATGPGVSPGDLNGAALAVGVNGTVLRYTAGQGWDSEQLLGSSGVARDTLRGVAWPAGDFAYAVGNDGAMWRWQRVTGLWEPDPGAPFDFQGQLMGVAFAPGDPQRGYAVGRAGTLLRYDKSWTQETLPDTVMHDGALGGPSDLMSVAFAGGQALVAAWSHVLVNDGNGWQVDQGAQALIDKVPGARIYAVAGLPDGGAVAAGDKIVLARDSGGGPWRMTDQPLPGVAVSAVAAFRENGAVRALVSAVPNETSWPAAADYQLTATDPSLPPPRLPAFGLPADGTLVRETATGWADQEHALLRSRTADRARKADPALAIAVDANARGWVVGGWTGGDDALNNGSDANPTELQTASVSRYASSNPEPAPAQAQAAVATPPGPARLLIGGGAVCESACAAAQQLDLMPDQTLARAVAQAATLAHQPNGPSALLYTGGRLPASAAPASAAELGRLADLLGAAAPLATFAAVSPGDEGNGNAAGFVAGFASAAAPLGPAAAPSGITPVAAAALASGGARTHDAADVTGPAGAVRVVVIDNAAGSLAASDPAQNPAEAQRPWLITVLDDARARQIPSIVMGSRSLDPADGGAAATDGADVAGLLRDHGASAYVYDDPGRQRATIVPAGDAHGIPAYGSGTLGYRPSGDETRGFGLPGLLLLELDIAHRDAATNRVPAAVRLVPVVEDVALEAVDGRVLNRSRPALFRGLGRRPRSGDRRSQSASGSDPYVALPNPSCAATGCAGRVEPEVTFTSSDPDIANFVRQDPTSDNPRKPYVDPASDKVVADATSGLLCAFNAGTTTVSVAAGGLTYSTTVTVRAGSVLRPCGTTPLSPARLAAAAVPTATPAPAPAPLPATAQPTPSTAPPAPVPAPPPPVAPPAAPPAAPAAVLATPFLPPATTPASLPGTPVPPPGISPRPIPPSGTSPVQSPSSVVNPATKVERQREEEIAPEQQQSAVRYVPGDHRPPILPLGLLVLAGALAGTAISPRLRRRDRGEELAMSYARERTTTRRYDR